MALIKAYVYNTEIEVNTAIDLINTALGIPVDENSVTRTYCEFEINNGNFILIPCKKMEPILGLPTDYEYL